MVGRKAEVIFFRHATQWSQECGLGPWIPVVLAHAAASVTDTSSDAAGAQACGPQAAVAAQQLQRSGLRALQQGTTSAAATEALKLAAGLKAAEAVRPAGAA